MSARRIRALIAIVVVLAVLGGVLLYATGRGALLVTLLGVVAVATVIVGVLWVIVTAARQGNWQVLGWLSQGLANVGCCPFQFVLGVTSVVTIGGLLLWHSLLVAALAGGSIMTMMLIVLSVAAASYKAGSQSS